QAEEEKTRAARGEQSVARGDQHAARGYREPPADQPVRDPAAEERQQEGAAQVQPPDRAGALIAESQSSAAAGCHQEQNEERLDAVIGEPLPHFREEERREAARMTE